MQKIDSLLKEDEFKNALSLTNAHLRENKLTPSSRVKAFLYKYKALRGLRTQEIPQIIKDFDEKIESSPDMEKKADLRLQKATQCLILSLLITAESEIQQVLEFYLKDKKTWKAKIRACYNVLAGVYFKRSDYDQALECLEKYEKLVDEEDQEATYLGMLGRVWMLKGELSVAEENLLKANEIYARLGNQPNISKGRENWIKTMLTMGWLELFFLYLQKRELRKSEEFLKKAHVQIKTWSEKDIGSIHTKAVYLEFKGALASAQGNNRLAHQCYEKVINMVLDLMEKERTPMEAVISQTSRLWAELWVSEKKYKQALIACESGFESAFEIDQKIEIGAIHRVWGRIYSETGDKRKAKDHLEKSIIFLERIGANYELGLTYLECGKSDTFDYFERNSYLDKAIKIFEEMEIDYFVDLASKSQKSLPERPISASEALELSGVVKGINKKEGMHLVEFKVSGAPLRMKIPSSLLPPRKANHIGAHFKLATGKQHGKFVPIFQYIDQIKRA
jgi:tetratricopeptide (TPR) repeat protein